MPHPREPLTLDADVLEGILRRAGAGLGPKPDRVTEAYADARIREKISAFPGDRQRGAYGASTGP